MKKAAINPENPDGVNKAAMDTIIQRHGKTQAALIPLLLAIQKRFHYLPQWTLDHVSENTDISRTSIRQIIAFYPRFRTRPAGRHTINVCMGTACHVRRSGEIHDALARRLDVAEGEDTTADGLFTIAKTGCLGCCMLAPVIEIDGSYYGHLEARTAHRSVSHFIQQSHEQKRTRSHPNSEYTFDAAPEGIVRQVSMCLCSSCQAAGAEAVYRDLAEAIERFRLPVHLKVTGCSGASFQAPAITFTWTGTPAEQPSSFETKPVGDPKRELKELHFGPVKPGEASALLLEYFPPPTFWTRARARLMLTLDSLLGGYDASTEPFEETTDNTLQQDSSAAAEGTCTGTAGTEYSSAATAESTASGSLLESQQPEAEHDARCHADPYLALQYPLVTAGGVQASPTSLAEYEQSGGFSALQQVLSSNSPRDVIRIIETSGLRGRGGGGFPTYKKWQLVHDTEGPVKYVVCNGDEGDPGAFMDRLLLESLPFRVIEGVIIAAYAVGATEAVLYIRAEYPRSLERVTQAVEACYRHGYLGDHIQGSKFSLQMRIAEGVGAFLCGEETALLATLEGRRGIPVKRPPYPAQEGLNRRPTLVNNVETFASVPYILREGPEKFAALGTETSKGTKTFALAGKVVRGGLVEVPMGTTIRQIVEDIGGGVPGGHKAKAVQIGGPSGGCIPASLFDTPVDYHSLTEAGAMMGSGGLVVLDETDCMVDVARFFLSFTEKESCGKCKDCRVGSRRMIDHYDRLISGEGTREDMQRLEEMAARMKQTTLCGLGRTASNPVLTTLRYFRDEYEAHLQGRCPAGKCKALVRYVVNESCIGCTLCAQHCPTDAIDPRPYRIHEVSDENCIRCGSCVEVCPNQSIDVLPKSGKTPSAILA